MTEDSREDCIRKPDLKTEAQRTNRFNNANTFQNSTSSCLTPCNHGENINVINDSHETHEKDDVPCINIVLKPISDSQTDQKDKGIQIVEVTAVTQNNKKKSINSESTCSKEKGKIKSKSVQVQTEVKKNLHDSSTQTSETPTDQKNICGSLIKEANPEITSGRFIPGQQPPDADINARYKGVQFKDNKIIRTDNSCCSNQNFNASGNPQTRYLPKDNSLCGRDAMEVIDIDDSMKKHDATSVSPMKCSGSMETLYKLINSKNKLNIPPELRSYVKKDGQKSRGKLSDRIKRNIDKLEVGNSCISTQFSATNTSRGESQRESIKTENKISACTDICKDIIASKTEFYKTYSDKSGNSSALQNSSTLASVFSNNPPAPKIIIDTTESTEFESMPKYKSSKVTIGTTISDSSFSTIPDFTPCCSNKRFNSGAVSKEKSINEEKFNSGTGTRGFWSSEISALSELGIDRNSSVETKFTNTFNSLDKSLESTSEGFALIDNDKSEKEDPLNPSNCCKIAGVKTNSMSFAQTAEFSASADPKFIKKEDFTLTRKNNGSFLRSSDLTRPEFIRMLTEIKEHTCSLELQLAAMNETMKRKQATRIKALSSTPKNYESVAYNAQNKKLKTTNEYSCCGSDFSSIEYASRSPEEIDVENGSCCGVNASSSPNESYTPLKSLEKPKTSSKICRAVNAEQIIVVPDELNISISQHRSRKAAYKTKRNLWSPARESDYRMWKHKLATPSVKSMILPEILPQTVSSNSSMVKSRLDASCSPANCCDVPEDSLQAMFESGGLSSINKNDKSDDSVGSACCSTTSNSSVNRMNVKPASMTSAFENNIGSSPSTEFKAVTRAESNNNQYLGPCGLHTSNRSNDESKSSQSTKMEGVFGAAEQSEEYITPASPFTSKRPEAKQRLGIKRSSLKSRTNNRRKSISSNSHIHSSPSRESFNESRSDKSSIKYKTDENVMKHALIQIKKILVGPQHKLATSNSRSPSPNHVENDSSRANHEENNVTISGANTSSRSNTRESLPAEEMSVKLPDQKQGKDQFTYSIMTVQNTPFSGNNFSKFDSEEEVSSTDYCGKKSKNDVNGKKRKKNSGEPKFTKINEKSVLKNSNTSKVQNSNNSPQLSQYREHHSGNLRNATHPQSISNNRCSKKVQELNNASEKSNQNNESQDKDSKCTIRVTVSLDDSPSNEKVEK